MGIRKFTGLVGSWIFSNSAGESGDIPGDDTPEEGTINDDDQTILVPALVRQQPSFDTELEHDDDQPGNKKRKATHDTLVIYDHEQGSSSASSSQPICRSDWLLSNDSSACHKKRALKFDTDKLFSRAHDVCKEVEHDEIQPKMMRRMEVQHWLTAVDRFRDEVQNKAIDDQNIENYTSQVDELLQRSNFPHGYVLPDDSPIEFPLLSKNPAGEMFATNTATILDWLKDNERCIIGVYGMGGVGKTTMLRCLYNEVLKNESNFGRPYWVTVSQNCDERKLQKEIAKELGVDLSGEGDDTKRAAILHKRLSTMGPTVLFLDDMWKWNPFLGKDIDFPIEGSSCKIILSSRSRKVCQEMGCKGFVIETKPLSEGEAWNLFVDKLGHYDKLTEEAKGIARSIAEKCGGLPLAIATMARSMTEVFDVRVWKNALNELRQPSCEQQSEMEEYVFSVLKYSYNHLNDQRLQNCFLSCILYPEDYKIPREHLIDEWIMEGLLDDVGNRSNQLNKGHANLNKLINSCLLEAWTDVFGSECVKMHDLMRDLGIMITKEYPCFMVKPGQYLDGVPEEQLWCKELVKVSLNWNAIKVIPNGMAPPTPELTLLKLNGNPLKRIAESFFMHMRALTVLDLSDTYIDRLPESVSDLANLRALLLASCEKLKYVPSLAKLSNLRVLDLWRAVMLEKAPDGIEKLKCLERVNYLPWNVSDSSGFNKLIQSLPSSLSCHRFLLSDPKWRFSIVDGIFDTYDFWESENIMLVVGEGEVIEYDTAWDLEDADTWEIEHDETWYMLPATIEILKISNVHRRNLGDVFPTLSLATNLKEMHIYYCHGLKYISSSSSEKQLSLPNLKHLWLGWCKELEEIFESNKNNHHNSALPNLVSVKVSSLPKLQRLYKDLHLCSSLEVLEVEDCPKIEQIFEAPEPILALPNSRELGLYKLENLSSIPRGLHLCSSLEVLKVMDCPKIEQIFEAPEPILALPNLRELKLDGLTNLSSIHRGLHLCSSLEVLKEADCPKIEQIFEAPEPILALPNLRELELRMLENLSSIHRGLHLCSSLEVLKVMDCPKIEQIFEAPEPILALPNLRELKLDGLTNLSSIHRGLHLCSSLEVLKVADCPKIEQIFEAPEPILALPNLRELELRKLENLSSIHRGLHLCSSLEVLKVMDCPKIEQIFEAPEPILALPNLRELKLDGLTNLSSIHRGLHLCSSLEVLKVADCPKIEQIFEAPEPILALPNLRELELRKLENLSSIHRGLHLCSSLEVLKVMDCPKIEQIFEAPEPILALPNLRELKLDGLTNLSSIHRGLHLCSSLEVLKVADCPKIEQIFETPEPILALPNLTELELRKLENLSSIHRGLHLCSSLEVLKVMDCPKIEQIFEAPEPILALPNLRELKLDGLTNLSSIHRGLHLCSSLEVLKEADCPKIEQIFEAPEPILALPNLRELELRMLENLSSIHRGLHLCSSLQVLEVVDCPEIEQIFEVPEPILALPKLRKLKLYRLTNLSSIHRGLLLCTSLKEFCVEGCFKVKKVPLSDHLICDDSPSSLLSLPSKSDNTELWALLQSDYSEDARLLSDFIQYHVRLQEHNQKQLKLKRKRSDLEGSTCDFTGYIDQVSLPASVIPDADEDKNNWLADQLLLPRFVLTEDERNQISGWGASLSLS
ncbi:uncharacterized protein LOC110693238 isoform X2 [Chenopodium quinoa]|uniref:uncharacterized protein LOC110693238 isoform X2 n=1 Tax=Chenopodium quinoa TaxID=63459 RepID=UPI000B78092F|nr:uncharacterized protein LOC110693238 isoform X2 [Chenopodium quinoa]